MQKSYASIDMKPLLIHSILLHGLEIAKHLQMCLQREEHATQARAAENEYERLHDRIEPMMLRRCRTRLSDSFLEVLTY